MKQKNKKKYEAPVLQVTLVELEQGIAAASATVSVGNNPATPNQPAVNDWGAGGLDTKAGDL